MHDHVYIKIINCRQCPHCDTKLTKGYGYATDYYCKEFNNAIIAGYVEWDSEAPQDNQIPYWCPLKLKFE